MKKKQSNTFIKRFAVPIILLAFVLLIQAFRPNRALLGWANLRVILIQSTTLGLIALGLSIIVIAGATDLSI